MCEKCKTIEEQYEDYYDDMDLEEDEDYCAELGQVSNGKYEDSFFEPMYMEVEDYDIEKFNEGVSEISKTCGMITALINVGLHPDSALNYIMSLDSARHNLAVSKINAETNIEVSKNNFLTNDKQNV